MRYCQPHRRELYSASWACTMVGMATLMLPLFGVAQVKGRPGLPMPPFLVEYSKRWRQALPRYGKLSIQHPTENKFREEVRRADAIVHGRIAEIRSYSAQPRYKAPRSKFSRRSEVSCRIVYPWSRCT